MAAESKLYNFVSYKTQSGEPRVGHLDLSSKLITPLSFASGSLVESLYDVIESSATFSLVPSVTEGPTELDSVSLLPPFTGRDILAVGKNYYDHAKEFNSSGFDSSDKTDTPSHPVIFTKRSTSIVPCGADIFLHPEFTETLDFEGEVGVVIGKPAYRVEEKDAMDYVWGYTIINDATARERQRDHKQFFIGKSADTLCPMGPIAVPKEYLPTYLDLKTYVNGKLRQSDSTANLIFSIPTLINVLSAGMTLQPGDVIATGTPAGVGIGLKPPVYLKSGDLVEIEVTGLGKLSNRVSDEYTPMADSTRELTTPPPPGLTKVGTKYLAVEVIGNTTSANTLICVHGLGGCSQYFTSLVKFAGLLDKYRVVLVDLEGFGRSAVDPTSVPSIDGYVADIYEITKILGITKNIHIIGFSMGCAIAELFTVAYPALVKKIVLLAPLTYPVSQETVESLSKKAHEVLTVGMGPSADSMLLESTSSKTLAHNPLAAMFILTLIKMTNPKAYAKGCVALSSGKRIPREQIEQDVLIITGDEDQWPSLDTIHQIAKDYTKVTPEIAVMPDTGHWHLLEAFDRTVEVVGRFL